MRPVTVIKNVNDNTLSHPTVWLNYVFAYLQFHRGKPCRLNGSTLIKSVTTNYAYITLKELFCRHRNSLETSCSYCDDLYMKLLVARSKLIFYLSWNNRLILNRIEHEKLEIHYYCYMVENSELQLIMYSIYNFISFVYSIIYAISNYI